jgi:tetratricopeptide (TPR) repeat protein
MENAGKEIAAAEALYQADPTSQANRMLLAAYRMDYGYKQAAIGDDRAGGLETLRKGSAMLEQMLSEDPQNLPVRRLLSLSYFRAADILKDDQGEAPQALALYKKAIATAQALVDADPNNADARRMLAYDHFALAELLAGTKDNNNALAQDREALSSFQKLAAADPASAQFQEDVAVVRGNIGEILLDKGDASDAIEPLRLAVAATERMSDAKNPQSRVGFIVVSNQFLLGKANTVMALSAKSGTQQKMEYCREAGSWFQKCLPAFEYLRDHAPAAYNGADRVTDIRREMARCPALTKP